METAPISPMSQILFARGGLSELDCFNKSTLQLFRKQRLSRTDETFEQYTPAQECHYSEIQNPWKIRTQKQIMNVSIIASQSISFSFHVWTSPNCIAFMTMIGHWIDGNFKYHEEVLEFRKLLVPIQANIWLIYRCIEDYNCLNKLLSLISDIVSNNLTFVPSLISLLSFNSKFSENGCIYFKSIA